MDIPREVLREVWGGGGGGVREGVGKCGERCQVSVGRVEKCGKRCRKV